MDSKFSIVQEATVQVIRAQAKSEELISELIVSSQGVAEKGVSNVEESSES